MQELKNTVIPDGQTVLFMHTTNRLLSHNWLVYKIEIDALRLCFQRYARGRLVDIGCGEKPYAEMLRPYVSEHVGIDHEITLHNKSRIDRFGSALCLPAEDGEFDSALCTSVLEHLEEPNQAIAECNRVLKTGGVAIYIAPLIWHLHECPRDFYRYTKYGLQYLFVNNGFEIVELRSLGGFWVSFGQLFTYYIYRFRKGGMLNPLWWVVPLVGFLIQRIAYILDRLDRAEQWTCTYLVVVRKK
jgi:SAM-dependent methyltransferase